MYLNCHTHFSLHYGTFSEKVLLEIAVEKQVQQLALTDINNTSACLSFIRLAPKYGIKPVVGIDFRNGNQQRYVGIAKNNKGFYELNSHLSEHKQQKWDFPSQAPDFSDVFIIYPFQYMDVSIVPRLRAHEFIGVRLHELGRLFLSPLYRYRHKIVLLQPVTFRHRKDFNTHRLLRAIHHNLLLSKLPVSEEADEREVMYSFAELTTLLQEHPFILQNSRELLEQCHISFDFSPGRPPQNQDSYTGSRKDDRDLILKLCEEGLVYRYGNNIPENIRERMTKELDLIEKMNFIPYFLINWDIVTYARQQNYFYVGRGSGANSIVAYVLRITDVDPIELDLYFERFINLYRANPPDFDIDFSWRDRDDVTRYIFGKFKHTALLATYNTFQQKAAIREIGKVLGLPPREIDELAESEGLAKKTDRLSQLVLKYSELIHGMPNHLSIHAGGILIANKPIHCFTATDIPPKGFPTTQFDMHIAEDVGLYKFDILGQRGLAKIKEALSIIHRNRPGEPPIDIHNVQPFIKDKAVNNMVKNARCLGCFYVESPAMRMLLKKLEVDNYLGLVAASSIIRPGVANSGMMREYILRHQDREKRKDAHPVLLNIMPETYGVMVYQEDVIKVAHYFADLTLGEADVLRRGMSGKFRSREEFKKVRQKFMDNCRRKNYSDIVILDVWRQIESFAGYAFAKGHSASYAVESYQTLFLKTYYPLEFMVAVLNNGGGFYRPEIYVNEMRLLGGKVHAPCVNRSGMTTSIRGKSIFLGFHFLKDLDDKSIIAILEERIKRGNFDSFDDFTDRLSLGIEQLSILIRINAFRFTGENKRKLLWKAHFKSQGVRQRQQQVKLFDVQSRNYELPELQFTELEDTFDQLELLGFTLKDPFGLLKSPPGNNLQSGDLPTYLNLTVTIYGYLVSIKNTATRKGDHMYFGTFLDTAGEFIDTTHFPSVAAAYPFRGKGIYAITGKVVVEFGFYSLEVSRMEKQAYVPDPRYDVNDREVANEKEILPN